MKSRIGALNAIGILAAVALSVGLARTGATAPEESARGTRARITVVEDATGSRIRVRAFRRIASASTVADRLLLDLCEPDRVIAIATASALGPDAHRFSGRTRIDRIDDVESIAALRPDLMLVHNVGDARRVERLRDASVPVFDLGPLEGMRSFQEDARQIAALCGAPERGERYLAALERRLSSIARHLAPRERKSAIYLSIYSDSLFGGTIPSSYHDVLEYAGLRDVAARRFRGWPQYSVEHILALDPDVIVTRSGMSRAICERPSFARVRACMRGSIVEIDGATLDEPGPGVLDAAEALYEAVYE
jgi:iron complex transport system substrate-binding protein